MRASYLPTILSLHVFSLSCQLPKYFQLQLQNSFYKLQLAKVNNSTRSAGLQFQSTKVVQYDQANYSLIHFYKRCVSGLAWWVAHLWVRSGWVSVFVSHKPSLFRAKESPLNYDWISHWSVFLFYPLLVWI